MNPLALTTQRGYPRLSITAVLVGSLNAHAAAWAQTQPLPAAPAVKQPPVVVPVTTEDAKTLGPKATPPAAGTASSANGPGADYKIAPNDLLDVEVFGVPELKRTVRVSSTGHVSLPLIGLVLVAGMGPADAEALIASQYASRYLQDPQVSVFIREFTTQRITLDGAVVKPGIYPLTGQITLLRALALAGGGAPLADLENVMLFRLLPDGRTQQERYDVLKIRKGEAPDPLLQGDDVVVVNRDPRRTALRDSLFRDMIDTLNPFSGTVRNLNAN